MRFLTAQVHQTGAVTNRTYGWLDSLGNSQKQYKTSLSQWDLYIQADPVMFTIAFLIVYTTLVSCLFEIYENDRFKFDIEQLLWVFMAVLIYRALNPRQRFYREIIVKT